MNAGRIALSVSVGTLALGLLAGCNAVTGASDLPVGSLGAPNGAGGAGGAGAGGASATGSGAGTSTGTPPTSCVYAATGFGNGVGKIVPPHRHWPGFPEGSKPTAAADAVTINLDDYFDCDGSKGINAILIDQSALWCGACEQAAADVNGRLQGPWAKLGIKVLTLLIDDLQPGQAATVASALKWKDMFHLDTQAVVADPQFTFIPPGASSIGLPLEVIIDPRTMTIVASDQGYSGDYAQLVQLAEKNSAP
jgi:hypothetical protein